MNKQEHQTRLDNLSRLRKQLREINNQLIVILKEIMATNTLLEDIKVRRSQPELLIKLTELGEMKLSLTAEKEQVTKILDFASQKLTKDLEKR